MRLAYRGTIDFNYRVDARVEARLLHDMWVVGPLVSLVFTPLTKLLEYKVTGTLYPTETRAAPHSEAAPVPLPPLAQPQGLVHRRKTGQTAEPAKPPPSRP